MMPGFIACSDLIIVIVKGEPWNEIKDLRSMVMIYQAGRLVVDFRK